MARSEEERVGNICGTCGLKCDQLHFPWMARHFQEALHRLASHIISPRCSQGYRTSILFIETTAYGEH